MFPGDVAARQWHLDGLDEFVEELMEETDIPGLALTVVSNDEVITAKGFGTRTAGKNQPVDEKTVFNIGSMTKAFTATALAVLVQRNELDWDTRLVDKLPYFRLSDPYLTDEMTVRDALSHRSGLPDTGWFYPNIDLSREEIIRRMRYIEPIASFRAEFYYNNAPFVAVAEVIHQVTGKSWDAFLTEEILAPAGMKYTITSHRFLSGENVASPHELDEDGKMTPVPHYPLDGVAAAGSILSNVEDLGRWCRLQLNRGSIEKKEIIKRDVMEEIYKPNITGGWGFLERAGYHNQSYASGWSRYDYLDGKDRLLAHGGAIDGARSWIAFSPQNNYCIVLLTNGGPAGDPVNHTITNWIKDRILGIEGNDWKNTLLVPSHKEVLADWAENYSSEGSDSSARHSLPLKDYVGDYFNPLFGDMSISLEGGSLRVRNGFLEGELEHWRADSFRADWSHLGESKGFVSFMVGPMGEVNKLVYSAGGAEREHKRREQ